MNDTKTPWPTELKLDRDNNRLQISFDNNETYDLNAEYLRVMSPSAETRGHGQQKKLPLAGKESVQIIDLKSVGNYAVRIVFDDGHQTGLYAWGYLRELGRKYDTNWKNYLDELAVHGLNRT